jgi:hypothetical protein
VRTWLGQTYWRRLLFFFVLDVVLAVLTWLCCGLRLDPSQVTYLVVTGFVLAARSIRDYMTAQWLCALVIGMLTPVAFDTGAFVWWAAWGVAVLMLVISTVMTVGKSIGERRRRIAPQGVWAVLPDGREIPLDVRPVGDDVDRGPRWMAYAIDQAISVPGEVALRVERFEPRRRGALRPALTLDENGHCWLATADDGTDDGADDGADDGGASVSVT